MYSVRINGRAASRVRSGHPWVYRGDLDAGGAQPGAVVRVQDARGHSLGVAHYSSASLLAVRMLPAEAADGPQPFFNSILDRAEAYRRRVVAGTGAFRLVHGEADLAPGLVIDRYGDYLCVQTLSQGMEAWKSELVKALEDRYQPRGIVERNDVASRAHEGLDASTGILTGDQPGEVTVALNGLQFEVDLLGGQKTGLFLDQRENWAAAAGYAAGSALDCFTYQGGFGLHLAAKCKHVLALDSSAAALEHARANAKASGIENFEVRQEDVFDALAAFARQRKQFDVVALDPPAFAKARRHVESAGRAYREINRRALQLLPPGGLLVSCSCSHHFSEADLLNAIAEASLETGKRLRVIERRTQARDHPIALTIPETHYLKCLIFEVY